MDQINVDVIVSNGTNVEVNSPSTSVDALINLPPPLSPTVTSPTYDTQACVVLPQGPIGPSGAIGPSGIPNTGELDLRYVNLTGNQTISGNKTFATGVSISGNLQVSETGIFNALDLSNISEFNFSGTNINLINGNVYISGGTAYISGNPVLTGIDLSSYATQANLNSTGSTLNSSINSLSGSSVLVYGNQTISGDKTFATGVSISGNLQVSNTGIFNALDLSNIDNLSLSGVDVTITSGVVSLTNRPTVNGTGVLLSGEAGNLPNTLVYTTGDQTINGLKDFTTRPTVNTIPVLLSGEVNTTISGILYSAQINIKNDNGSTIYRGQPVYVSSAAGSNILVKLASNSGEQTSSKTLGLVYQTSLAQNAQGTIVTEGLLQGFNTNAGEEGDPIWLGPTGSLIFGLANKPYAPNHLVYLGVLTRKHANQGEVFVKIQNGFELEELHNVNINHTNALADKNIIRYNSLSGIWFNDTINSVLPNSIVYITGNQTISGIKLFSGIGTSVNFTSGASLTVSGRSVLTGIAGTGDFITLNQLNQSYRHVYVSPAGSDGFGRMGNINRPFQTAQAAWNAILNDWGGGNPSPIEAYVLNFYAGNWAIDIGAYPSWPLNIFIRGLSPRKGGFSSQDTSLNISHTPKSPGEAAPGFTIRDLGIQSIKLTITSLGGSYGGGLPTNGGNAGNITLYDCYASFLRSEGGLASFGQTPGTNGNISLYNCTVDLIDDVGNLILQDSTYNSASVSSAGYNSANLINSKVLSNNILSAGANLFSHNTFITSSNETLLYSNVNSYLTSGKVSIRNNNLSGILGQLTLHDNQNRPHLSGAANTLTIDFASGIKIANTFDANNNKIINAVPDLINTTSNFFISGNSNSRMILANNSSQITGVITSGNATGFNTSIIQIGAGQIQITGSGIGIGINSYNNQYKTAGQFATISLLHTGNNQYIMYGNTAL